MKNLTPQLTIGFVGIVSYFIWGFWGLVGGIIVGYVLVTLIGTLAMKISGGLLPKEMRKSTAQEFIVLHGDWLVQNTPSDYAGREQVYVEYLLERIARTSATIGPSSSSGLSLIEVQMACEDLISEEADPQIAETLERLAIFLESFWYK